MNSIDLQIHLSKTHVANEVRLNIHVGFPSLCVANVEQEHFSNDTREEKCNFFCQDLLLLLFIVFGSSRFL